MGIRTVLHFINYNYPDCKIISFSSGTEIDTGKKKFYINENIFELNNLDSLEKVKEVIRQFLVPGQRVFAIDLADKKMWCSFKFHEEEDVRTVLEGIQWSYEGEASFSTIQEAIESAFTKALRSPPAECFVM